MLEVAQAWGEAWAQLAGIALPAARPLMPTPRDELALEGGARLYHFRNAASTTGVAPRGCGVVSSAAGVASSVRAAAGVASSGRPILLVPSLINRWYVLDLRSGASLVEALVGAGCDVWCLDWGIPEAEDRYLDWEMVHARLGRCGG